MKAKKTAGATLAMAAAGLLATAPMSASAGEEAKVHCFGVNKCAGQNDCKTAQNACAGKASCKGHGFVSMSRDACEKIGGEIRDNGNS